jgi:hypothetical protein
MLQPGEVQAALDRMKSGEASAEVLEVIVAGAEGFAALVYEYVFRAPIPGAVFATQNDMLAETMQAGRPNERMLLRLAPPLPEWPEPSDPS